jgi:hypothetical protein
MKNFRLYPPTLLYDARSDALSSTQRSEGFEMRYSIDWLSFSVPFEPITRENSRLLGPLVEASVKAYMGELIDELVSGQSFTLAHGRRPYAASWGRDDGGVRFFGAPTLAHVLVEISGTGCKTLRAQNSFEEVLSLVHQRVSRIDLAIDIETETTPSDFVIHKAGKSFKSSGYIKSETGETCYVGSQKSDRWARVYRYAKPHPRANDLRVEHVFRRGAAKSFALALLSGDYAGAVVACGNVFGWTHKDWQTGSVHPLTIKTIGMRREKNNTINWIYGAVTSSIVKAVKAGTLDINDWLAYLEGQLC